METYSFFKLYPVLPLRPPFLCVSKVFCTVMRHRGGVFLTVIATSHTPFKMNNKTAGKKYLLTGMC
jgi:hypothetical protein